MEISQDIYNSALRLLFPLPEEKTYQVIIEEAIRLVKGKHASIFLFKNGRMKRAYSSSKDLFHISPRPNGITMRVYQSKNSAVRTVQEIEKCLPESWKIYKKLGVEYDLNVPLFYKKRVFGVLSVMSLHKSGVEILELFGPLASLAINNMQTREKLSREIKTRDFFISLAAHEFKTPLTSINLYAEMLLQNKADGAKEEVLKQKLLNETQRLSRLFEEVLEIDKIQFGTLEFAFKKTQLSNILSRAKELFETVYIKRHLVVQNTLSKESEWVYADIDKLIQVLTNLLENAVKYSPPETIVTLSVNKNDKQYTIAVMDKGDGIVPKDIPKIFSKFYRGKSSKEEGMGLGLFLVKYILERHKGTISVKSIVGEGTTMTITLPVYSV